MRTLFAALSGAAEGAHALYKATLVSFGLDVKIESCESLQQFL